MTSHPASRDFIGSICSANALAEWLGLARYPRSWEHRRVYLAAGSLKFGESPDRCRNVDVLQRQRAAIEWLGSEKFFDIRFPDRKRETPDWGHMPVSALEHG